MSDNTPEKKPTPPPTATRINDQGLIEIVDLFTGRVLSVQTTPNDNYLKNRFEDLVSIDTEEGPVWIEKHIDPGKVMHHIRAKNQHRSAPQFSLAWAHLLAGRLLEGETLTQATLAMELKLALVKRWALESAEFKQILDQAKVARAETFQDEALDAARKHKDQRPDLHVQTLMKQAAQSDREQYGEKSKVEHSGEIAHTILVDTAIRRNQLPPAGFEDAIRDATPLQIAQTNAPEKADDASAIGGSRPTPVEKNTSEVEEERMATAEEESIWKPGRAAEESSARHAVTTEQSQPPKPSKPDRSKTHPTNANGLMDFAGQIGRGYDQKTMDDLPDDSEF